MGEKSLDDICLEIYLGELVKPGKYGWREIEERLELIVKTAREVNTGIWSKGITREFALHNAGFDPVIIQTVANHEYAKDLEYNGC